MFPISIYILIEYLSSRPFSSVLVSFGSFCAPARCCGIILSLFRLVRVVLLVVDEVRRVGPWSAELGKIIKLFFAILSQSVAVFLFVENWLRDVIWLFEHSSYYYYYYYIYYYYYYYIYACFRVRVHEFEHCKCLLLIKSFSIFHFVNYCDLLHLLYLLLINSR